VRVARLHRGDASRDASRKVTARNAQCVDSDARENLRVHEVFSLTSRMRVQIA
jgi:hypothetical protein